MRRKPLNSRSYSPEKQRQTVSLPVITEVAENIHDELASYPAVYYECISNLKARIDGLESHRAVIQEQLKTTEVDRNLWIDKFKTLSLLYSQQKKELEEAQQNNNLFSEILALLAVPNTVSRWSLRGNFLKYLFWK